MSVADYTIRADGLIRRESDGALIPRDPDNSDYGLFLAWEAEGGVLAHEAPPAPQPVGSVPAWAAKAALDEAGLLDQVEALALSAGLTWKHRFLGATEWQRGAVLQLAPQMSPPITETQVDALLARAAALAASA